MRKKTWYKMNHIDKLGLRGIHWAEGKNENSFRNRKLSLIILSKGIFHNFAV